MDNTQAERIGNDVLRVMDHAKRWLKLEAADKLTVAITCVIVAAIVFALVASAVFFISMGVMKSIAAATGNEMLSCYIVGAALLLIAFFFYLMRKPLVENKVVQSVTAELFDDDDASQSTKGGMS